MGYYKHNLNVLFSFPFFFPHFFFTYNSVNIQKTTEALSVHLFQFLLVERYTQSEQKMSNNDSVNYP